MKKIKRITPPTFRVMENFKVVHLNELEVRQLQVDIKNGIWPSTIVTDEKDNLCTIGPDGKFDKVPYGFSLHYELAKQLLD